MTQPEIEITPLTDHERATLRHNAGEMLELLHGHTQLEEAPTPGACFDCEQWSGTRYLYGAYLVCKPCGNRRRNVARTLGN